MTISIARTTLEEVKPWRVLYLAELNAQSRYHAYHERRRADYYTLEIGGVVAGYVALMDDDNRNERMTVFECFAFPLYRQVVSEAFPTLTEKMKATTIIAQMNDLFTAALLEKYGEQVQSEALLFSDLHPTEINSSATFRKRREGDSIFTHHSEPVGDFVLTVDEQVVATGGYMTHYNFPFVDLYMEVDKAHRRKGYGSFLIQEIKKVAYSEGRVPAARCNVGNDASKATLLRAGMTVAGEIRKAMIRL